MKRGGPGEEPGDFGNNASKASFNFGDADPQVVDCVMQFFYLWDYEIMPLIVGGVVANQNLMYKEDADESSAADGITVLEGAPLILHSKVFTLAHIYDIPRLRQLSVDKFQAEARLKWETDCLLDAAREAYTATPSEVSEMREAIVDTFYDHPELLDQDHIRTFLLDVPSLTLDILMRMKKPSALSGVYASGWLTRH